MMVILMQNVVNSVACTVLDRNNNTQSMHLWMHLLALLSMFVQQPLNCQLHE